MAVEHFVLAQVNGAGPYTLGFGPGHIAYYQCDTEIERPAGVNEGDLAYTRDTNKNWAYDGAAWNELGGGGPGGTYDPVTDPFLNR